MVWIRPKREGVSNLHQYWGFFYGKLFLGHSCYCLLFRKSFDSNIKFALSLYGDKRTPAHRWIYRRQRHFPSFYAPLSPTFSPTTQPLKACGLCYFRNLGSRIRCLPPSWMPTNGGIRSFLKMNGKPNAGRTMIFQMFFKSHHPHGSYGKGMRSTMALNLWKGRCGVYFGRDLKNIYCTAEWVPLVRVFLSDFRNTMGLLG